MVRDEGGESLTDQKVSAAIKQWREALVSLTATNRLLNYRPTRASTIEFSRHSASEAYHMVASGGKTFTVGTRPAEPSSEDGSAELERAVLTQLPDFDFESYPDHLFTDKTQRDVDRILRNLAGRSKREFLDKGLRTLYVALGELRWKEGSGDERRSPLLLMPAELDSLGPRERMYLEFSDDDIAVNPALALRVSEEHGLILPSAEDVRKTLETEGMDRVLVLFREIAWPPGWEIRDFAALGTFMFAKEAMYQDLLEHEKEISESVLVQALSGGISPDASPFVFEPHNEESIDEAAPPETVALVLDADASQRAAVQAAVEGRSFVLDGPPGTGKSQTIANIIGALIERGKTVLFVSEKAVALDVVRDRLTERELGPFLFELHSSKVARKEVATRLGQALQSEPVPRRGMTPVVIAQLQETRAALTRYVVAANETRSPLEESFHYVLGLFERVRSEREGPGFAGDPDALSPGQLATIEKAIKRVTRRWALHLQGSRAVWFGLIRREVSPVLLEDISSILRHLGQVLDETRTVRSAFDLVAFDDLGRASALLESWHKAPEFQDDSWLDQDDFGALTAAVEVYERVTANHAQAAIAVKEALGAGWEQVPRIIVDELPELDVDLLEVPGVSLMSTGATIVSASEAITESSDCLEALRVRSEALAAHSGAQVPHTLDEVRSLQTALNICLSEYAPPAEWLYESQSLAAARTAFTVTRAAQDALDLAEREASPFFTEKLLTSDLISIEQLSTTTVGFFRRFSSDHKVLRQALSEISPVKWQQALSELPRARTWVDAHQAYAACFSEAQRALGPLFSVDRSTDWNRIERIIENASAASTVHFQSRSMTECILSDIASQLTAKEYLNSSEEAFTSWESKYGVWAAKHESRGETFQTLRQRLADRSRRIHAFVEIVKAQAEHLGPEATLDSHLNAALARSRWEMTAEAVRAGATCLHSFSVDVHKSDIDAETARRKLDWARSVLSALQVDGDIHGSLTNAQINALKESIPVASFSKMLSEYEASTANLTQWFDEDRRPELCEDFRDFRAAADLIDDFQKHMEETEDWFDLERALADIEAVGLGDDARYAQSREIPDFEVENFFRASVYRSWLDRQIQNDSRLRETDSGVRDEQVREFRDLDVKLSDAAVARIIDAGATRRPRSTSGQTRIITNEAGKKRKHIAVRDLIGRARDAILAVHPCFMMSPLAVSQYLPPERLFDVVIFDEASQVLPADAINCVYRGTSLIAAGDQKQLPPTSFFTKVSDDLDEDSDEDVATDFESLLELMKSSGSFTSQSLKWHYRSRHESLIAYSNASFYDSRLITFPGALSESPDAGVRFFKVPGIYRRSAGADNPIEAKHVADRVMHHFTTRPDETLGVVAFSTKQRDAIENALELARSKHPDLDGYFEEDRLRGFFVKSLEEVQGDERDVIIFSIGYGPDENGRTYKNFGPVGREGGERRLNVAVTRAKALIEVVTSMSASDIGEVNSTGARHLRKYLDFAERGQAALELELGPAGLDTDSPFEDAVVSYVRSLGFDVQPQVGAAGYRIDIGVKHPNQPGAFMLGIECDGAMYHSSRAARDRDRLRHQVLEGLGWHLHHIWGTAWYRHPNREKERLSQVLEEFASRPAIGRITVGPGAPPKPQPHTGATVEVVQRILEEKPSWAEDYRVARVKHISPDIDLSSSSNARRISSFVEEIASAEAPLHFSVLEQRLREHSSYGRIGARIRQTLRQAVQFAEVHFQDDYIRLQGSELSRVRRGTDEFMRTAEQVPDEELRLAVRLSVSDAVGITRPELLARVVSVFGWRRTGTDIRSRVERSIDALLQDGVIEDAGAGLRLKVN